MNNRPISSDRALASVESIHRNGTGVSTEVKNPAIYHDDDVVDPYILWRLITRYKQLLIGLTLAAALLALLASMLLRPMYTAEATVRVNLNTSIASDSSRGGLASTSWQDPATALNLLKGRQLAEQVVVNLELTNQPEFTGELRQRSVIPNISAVKATVFSWLGRDAPPKQSTMSQIESAGYYLRQRMLAEEVPQTRLLKIKYTSFSPEISALVANGVTQAFNELDAQRLKDMSNSAQSLLQTELQEVQVKLQTSEKKLNQFARKTGIVDLDDENNLVSARSQSLGREYLNAQNERMKLEIQVESALQSGNLLSLPFINESNSIIELRAQLTQVEAEYGDMATIFKPEYPELMALGNKVSLLKKRLSAEAQREFDGLAARYKNAIEAERVLSKEIEQSNIELLDLKDRAITFNLLKREWQSNTKLYEGLLEKVKAAGVSARLEMSRLSLVDAAAVPLVKSSPNITKNVALAASAGFFIALAVAFLLNLLDRRFRSIQELEEFTKIPVLTVIPFVENEQGIDGNHVALLSAKEPASAVGETFRSLRTSLMYSMPDQDLDTLMVTSAGPSEGKSTTIVNLGTTLASNGIKVVLVDFDLRKPSIHKIIGKSRAPGVTDALISGSIAVSNNVADNFTVITAGTATPNPTEMLESQSCRNLITHLRKQFDVVLFDAPPVMGLADALVVSQYSKNMLMVVDMCMSNKDSMKGALRRLERVNASLVGMVVTKHDDYDYQNSNYYYYYSDDESEANEQASAESLQFSTRVRDEQLGS